MKLPIQLSALAVAAGAGFAGVAVSPELEARQAKNLDVHESYASASLVGQFRTSVSAWLWLRTDLYLHNGVEMRPLTEAEKQDGKSIESAAQDDGLHEDENIVTVVPSAKHDFRGVFGDIERLTTSYKPMSQHQHNQPDSALPLFRLMTWLDPKFIRGWTVGASVIGQKDSSKAIAYLSEGLEANPTSSALYAEMGQEYAGRQRQYKTALPYLDKAIAAGEKRFPEGITDPDSDEAEGFLSAMRYAALCYRKLDDLAKMRAVANYGLKYFPDDPVLLRSAAGTEGR